MKGEGQVKSVERVVMGRCADCGTLHAHATTGCICYLCRGYLWVSGQAELPVVEAPVCSKTLINELYARREAG